LSVSAQDSPFPACDMFRRAIQENVSLVGS
jgi:hypothetical protein